MASWTWLSEMSTETQTALDDALLSRFYDGELDEAEADACREALEADEELRLKHGGLERLSELMRAAATTRGEDVDTDALFEAIEAKIALDIADDEPMFPEAAPKDAARPRLKALAGGRSEAARKQRAADETTDGASSKKKTETTTGAEEAGPEARPAHNPAGHDSAGDGPASEPATATDTSSMRVGLVLTGLAAAAAFAFFYLRPGGTTIAPHLPAPTAETAETPSAPIAATRPPAPAPPQPAPQPAPGSEVEEVDFGESTGAVFELESPQGARYAVVWISDEQLADEPEPESEHLK